MWLSLEVATQRLRSTDLDNLVESGSVIVHRVPCAFLACRVPSASKDYVLTFSLLNDSYYCGLNIYDPGEMIPCS